MWAVWHGCGRFKKKPGGNGQKRFQAVFWVGQSCKNSGLGRAEVYPGSAKSGGVKKKLGGNGQRRIQAELWVGQRVLKKTWE